MDILILNWKDIENPEVGGAEVIAFEFARRLVKEGHTVSFFARNFKNSLPTEIRDGVKIIRKGNRYTIYFHAYIYFRKLRIKPDKVLEMVNTIAWQTPLYVKKSNRVIYINQLAKEVFFYELPWPISFIAYYLERFQYFFYKNSKILCYSNSTKKDLESFHIPGNKINVFPMGLDHKRYIPSNKKSVFPHFVFVARLVKMKRAELCIRAMAKIVEKYSDVKLSIVGTGPDQHRLVNLVNDLKLQSNVEFVDKNNFYLDKSKSDRKVKLMQEAWCLLLPSTKEGWGMVVTEAAACGTPSIVTNVTGLQDAVKQNITGIIISKNPSVEELSDAMFTIIDNPTLLKQLSQNAIKWSKEFSWDKSFNAFRNLLLK